MLYSIIRLDSVGIGGGVLNSIAKFSVPDDLKIWI